VPRTPVLARLATISDVPVLVGLWKELRQVGGRAERAVNPVAVADIEDRLAAAIASDNCRVVLAYADEEAAGMAVFRAIRPDPLSESLVLQISHLIVAGGKRRRGVGRALLMAAAETAEELGIEHVGVGIYPSLRDANRFYARSGFAPVLAQRIAPVSVLRRRLSGETASVRIDDVVRRRTRIRRPLPAQRAMRRAPESSVKP
jgi:GNAT superfamily N-acetyltransferase